MSNILSKSLCLIFIISIYNLISIKTIANAQTMSSQNYILKGDVNTAGGQSSNQNSKLNLTVGQTAQEKTQNTNYKIQQGQQYIRSSDFFVFTVTLSAIDFGVLSPTNPIIRTSTIKVSNPSSKGYSVSISEDHPLQASNSASFIPDTTCDSGVCSESIASAWTSTLSFGFGYRCNNLKGADCASDFSNQNFYKQFANTSTKETPQVIMQSNSISKGKEAQIVYKLNIAGTQPSGSYSNTISLIASPNY